MDEQKTASMIGRLFCYAFDRDRRKLKECLHTDAVLDWFGQTISGQEKIIKFLDTKYPTTEQYVFSAKFCEPVKHRSKLRRKMDNEDKSAKIMKVTDEELSLPTKFINNLAGFDKVNLENLQVIMKTPEDNVSMILVPEEMLKNDSEVKAVAITASLYLYSNRTRMTPSVWERKLKHILLEFDECIRLIVYEGNSGCRRNLCLEFDK